MFEEGWSFLYKDIDLRDLVAKMFGRFHVNAHEDSDGEENEDFYGEENEGFDEAESKAIDEVKILGFSPENTNIILFSYHFIVWVYNIDTKSYKELIEPSFVANMHTG
ncbi:uncharacterized protein LOC113275679 [Papaver somniferum]|uniref:uncharacterized protein LOC113275679 n=1 Tax=Papaver somniferum TaxID=3469 RepID=UPI000E6F998A|nr:uncharacterized protein LOC113275679 [Papaver somniferum]